MKNLRKIIALFLFIFLAGIVITAISIDKTLDKKIPSETSVVEKDSLKSKKTKQTNTSVSSGVSGFH